MVIPCFNSEKWVVQAIDSALAQGVLGLEVVVVNDGSINKTQQIIQEYGDRVLLVNQDNFELIIVDDRSKDDSHSVLSGIRSDPRMMIVLNKINKGQSAVLNQALKLARGEFICLLPSDDWYLPNKLSLQIKKFSQCEENVGLVYGRGLRYYSDINKTLPANLPMRKGWVLERLIKEPNFVYPVTPMFQRGCFEFSRPDDTYKVEGDAIYLKIALKYKFDYVENVIAVIRDHSYNTGKVTKMMYVDNIRYWTEFFSRKDIPEDIRKLRGIPIARLHRLKGLESIILEKNFAGGRAALFKSIIMKPSNVFDLKILIGLVISMFPHSLVDRLIDRRVGVSVNLK